ncbi:MAG: glycoside hydrolase family 3 C-terminal domain-containing protein, partial [Oscillospiraceae bacterium]|nr:glycoside hydrolase family 3 C-terminal domain-containing protein [Oscillospiraceae bacterium]
GALGGQAIAEAIFGAYSPEGKLPVTFYRSDGDLPDFHDYAMKNRTYRYFKGEPLYPFGFGLSYATFALSGFKAGRETCAVTVENTGAVSARQTVQIYVETPGTKEVRTLAGIAKVFLDPGERREVTVQLGRNAFSRFDEKGDPQVIKGVHTLYAGLSQPDARSAALTGVAPLKAEISVG